MIDARLFERYRSVFGETFTPSHWERRPGDTLNRLMRAALDGEGPIVTDEQLAVDLASRVRPER